MNHASIDGSSANQSRLAVPFRFARFRVLLETPAAHPTTLVTVGEVVVGDRLHTSQSLGVAGVAGDMGRKVDAHDWGRTPLGPVASWPRSLTAVVRVMLSSKYPMFMAVGPELRMLYNDAYRA